MSNRNISNPISEAGKLCLDEDRVTREMVQLGFWSGSADDQVLLDTIVTRQDELVTEIRQLLVKKSKNSGSEEALASLRQKYRENKLLIDACQKQNSQEKQRQQQISWNARQSEQIFYLGEKVSTQLNSLSSDQQRLTKQELPYLNNAQELATAMGISVPELRFLAFSKKTSRVRHYKQFDIPKKPSGFRRIAAPMPRLKRIQYWILDNILGKVAIHNAAHGFRAGRSIISNAKIHTRSSLVINIDLKNFFPTITYPRVKGLFSALGYSGQLSTLLALVCTEFDFEEVGLDGLIYFVGRGDRKTPQGAPSSPAVSNLVCRRMDARLHGMAKKLGYQYTRYADDMTFSSRENPAKNSQQLLWRCKQIIKDEGFIIHPDKTRIMRKHCQQEVTGLIVNEKISVNRKSLKNFRALLYQILKDGFDGKQWNGKTGVGLADVIQGYAQYIFMIDKEKGRKFLEVVKEIKNKHTVHLVQDNNEKKYKAKTSKQKFREQSAKGDAPYENWWVATSKVTEMGEVENVKKLPEPLYRKAIQLAERKNQVYGLTNNLENISAKVPDKVVEQEINRMETNANKTNKNIPIIVVSLLLVVITILYLTWL